MCKHLVSSDFFALEFSITNTMEKEDKLTQREFINSINVTWAITFQL